MIDVYVKDWGDHWTMSMTGHAGYADEGQDIVCAGASALWLALLAEVQESCDHFSVSGEFDGAPHTVTAWGCRYAMRMILRGFHQMEGAYPAYITVLEGVPYES